MDNNLERLMAIEEIKILKARYLRGLDTRNFDLLRSVLSAEVRVDVRGATTDPVTGVNAAPHVSEQPIEGREAVLAAIASRPQGVRSVHHGSSPEITFSSAGKAHGIWALSDRLDFPHGAIKSMVGIGYYHDSYVVESGHWLISEIRIERLRLEVGTRE